MICYISVLQGTSLSPPCFNEVYPHCYYLSPHLACILQSTYHSSDSMSVHTLVYCLLSLSDCRLQCQVPCLIYPLMYTWCLAWGVSINTYFRMDDWMNEGINITAWVKLDFSLTCHVTWKARNVGLLWLCRCSVLDGRTKGSQESRCEKNVWNHLLLYYPECLGSGSAPEVQVHTSRSREWDCVHPGLWLLVLKSSSWGVECVIIRAPDYWECNHNSRCYLHSICGEVLLQYNLLILNNSPEN